MSISLDRTLLEEVALVKVGISEAFIEKDWFVIKAIRILSADQYLDFVLVFTGGTSLSKAHKLIERFSEDVDFKMIAPSLDRQGISKMRKSLSDFKKHVATLLEEEFQVLGVEARDGNRHIIINLAYPSVCEPAEALRPHIKLEFTLSNLVLPSVELPVSSFINEVAGQAPEVEKIACIDPVENAADKLSALIWRILSRVRGEDDKQPDIVRHLHDLAKLNEPVAKNTGFGKLAQETIERDANRAEAIKGLTTPEKLSKILAVLDTDPEYHREYETYVKQMSYSQDASVPSFQEALENLKLIVAKVV